ncbi:selenium cofactor biosynthesis protein YqeC [Clostridium weizhouense]|uniref:Selenium-dependent hydroxylase accessory protein YqeC n=1 Tax=Clostridium weizhouense TaxID=2859781 RepID=A0ABS7AJX6_9CLOT|nr:putative selenium-dependent hydroxylase accessory protein YqeC [Clostridium weizhouense]
MKIFKCENTRVSKAKSLIQVLNIDITKKLIISFVGGGGKTSLIYQLGDELSKLGKKVIITTTTHMLMPESNVVVTGKKDDITKFLYNENMVTVGLLCDEKKSNVRDIELKKIKGLSKETAESLIELADFVLVEADGAKRLPLKMPAEHEPVILEGSNLVVGVCGIDSVGKSINEICHRPNLVSKFLNTDEQHIINECDIAQIVLSEKGQKKDVKCDYKVVINKVDDRKNLEIAKNILHEFLKLGANELILTTFRGNID